MSVTWPLAVNCSATCLPSMPGRPEFQRADALRRFEEECLQAELLAQQFQQVLVLLLHSARRYSMRLSRLGRVGSPSPPGRA